MSKIHFFTKENSINISQTHEMSFGDINDLGNIERYNLENKFNLSENASAFSICKSLIIYLEDESQSDLINAILLPYVIRYNATEPTKFVSWPKYEYYIANKKYATIARKIGLKADTVEEGVDSLIAEVRKMNEELNIPKSFKDAGIDEKEFLAKVDLLADRAFEDQCTTANPRVPLVSEIKQMLLDSYYGK